MARNRTLGVGLLAVVLAMGWALSGAAAEFPRKPVQVIVGFGPGGDADINGRFLAKSLEKQFGRPVVITNMAGAAGTLGAEQVKTANPDGYTALFTHWGMLTNELSGMIDYNVLDAFEIPAISVLDTTTILVGNGKVGRFKNAKEMFAAAADPKAEPVKISIDTGSLVHLQWLILQKENNVSFQFIDTGTPANRIAALMSNQVDAYITQYFSVKDLLAAGEFANLGVIAPERNQLYPDIPTFGEQGIIGLEELSQKYFHLALPKGTPREIIDAYKKALKGVAEDPEAIKRFTDATVSVVYIPEEEAKARIAKVREIVFKYKDLFAQNAKK